MSVSDCLQEEGTFIPDTYCQISVSASCCFLGGKEKVVAARVPKRVRPERSPEVTLVDDRAIRIAEQQLSVNGVEREAERGALGLAPDKMVLVRQKKEEIEKVRLTQICL